MPELPEVETIRRQLIQQSLIGAKIKSAEISWSRTIHTHPVKRFVEKIKGKEIKALSRRGKYLILNFEKSALLIHLRMSGRINLFSSSKERSKYDRAILILKDGRELRFHDTRKFGRWYLVAEKEEVIGKMGPEPLSPQLTPDNFWNQINTKKRTLKPLLLDQNFIAGLGNIYVDESLFEAKLHPQLNSRFISRKDSDLLFKAIQKILKRGIKNCGTSLGDGNANFYSVGKRRGRNQDELKVFRRTGDPCFDCKGIVERIVVGGRGTHFCPNCQKLR